MIEIISYMSVLSVWALLDHEWDDMSHGMVTLKCQSVFSWHDEGSSSAAELVVCLTILTSMSSIFNQTASQWWSLHAFPFQYLIASVLEVRRFFYCFYVKMLIEIWCIYVTLTIDVKIARHYAEHLYMTPGAREGGPVPVQHCLHILCAVR